MAKSQREEDTTEKKGSLKAAKTMGITAIRSEERWEREEARERDR